MKGVTTDGIPGMKIHVPVDLNTICADLTYRSRSGRPVIILRPEGEPRPVSGQAQPGDDMPHPPPGGDEGHAPDGHVLGKDQGIEEEGQGQPRILDAGLDGDGPALPHGQSEHPGQAISAGKGQQVVDQDDEEDILDVLEEVVVVLDEDDHDHGRKGEDGQPLDRDKDGSRQAGEFLTEQDAGHQRNADDQQYGAEHLHGIDLQGAHQLGRGACGIDLHEQAAPEGEVEGGEEQPAQAGEGGQADGQGHVAPGQGTDEVGDVATGAGGHQDHAQADGRGDTGPEGDGQQEGDQGHEHKLAGDADQHRAGRAEQPLEVSRSQFQSNAEHDAGDGQIEKQLVVGTEVQADLVDVQQGFQHAIMV